MRYSLGLDIGITSVGWALLDLDNKRIGDLGVRLFTGAENPKDGSSLAAPRREARGARRRLRRKRQRLSSVKKLILSEKILSETQMENIFDGQITSPWELRSDGLDRLLSPAEWSRVLIHITKHRGFKSNRTLSADDKSSKASEDGKAKEGMKANSLLLSKGNGGCGYRTVGEMIFKDDKFAEHKRNKGGDYSNTITRDDLENEVKILFESQRNFKNPNSSKETEEQYIEIFKRQLPFASGEIIEKMVGFCTLEPPCKRAPKASWTSERYILLTKIVNLRAIYDGKKYELSAENNRKISDLAYSNAKVTYKQIKKAIGAPEELFFENMPSKKDGNPEDAAFAELKAFHAFRKAITKELGEEYWKSIINTTPTLLDTLAFALTYRKTDSEIRDYLNAKNIDPKLTEAVLPLNFSGNVNLSIEAMTKLIPFMEMGYRYDEACEKVGYCHYRPDSASEKTLLLPIPDSEELRNPVVFRAVTQTRKVVNAIIRKYGSPETVQVELARDLSKSKEERKKIEDEQKENRNQRAGLSDKFESEFNHRPNGAELEKYRLWKEQGGFCPYSGEYIEPRSAFQSNDGTYAEIDHIIPYSRSFDDSLSNKVLVIGSENRNKGNRTPYEYLGSDAKAWDEFTARVDAYISNRKKAERLTRKDFDAKDSQEMTERNLSDTRYITKYVAAWIEQNLIFSDPENKQPVHRLNGRATSVLRRQWGINSLKDRAANDLHHALDACVIAASTPSMIKSISDFSRKRELSILKKESEDGKKTRTPEPWPHFRKEIEARMSDSPADKIKEFGLENYDEETLSELKPIFISRKPERKADGASHEATIRSIKGDLLAEGKTAVKTSLLNIKLSSLENMAGKERDTKLYEALKQRLKEFKDEPKKAFKEPFRKPTNDGTLGPIVRSIKIKSPGVSGVRVCSGLAANGSMVRVDVYTKGGKYFLIPYYVDDIAKKKIKNRAITANKKESDWEIVDNTYTFMFSIFRNDLLRVVDSKKKEIFGYYVGTDISTGSIEIKEHSGACSWRGIGVRTAKSIEKYQVDVLGSYYKVKKERPPHELA